MATQGLSVKERRKLLENNNNNNTNTNNNNTITTTKATPSVTPKPKPQPSDSKPSGGVEGLKPVTLSKPATPGLKPEPASKPVTTAKLVTPIKPLAAAKPPPSNKLGTTLKPSSPKVDEDVKSNGADSPLFPKLRSVVGESPAKVPPPVPKSLKGVGGEKPASEAASSQEAGGSESSTEIPEKSDRIVSPLKPVSVQERLAAIQRRSSTAETKDPKVRPHHNSVSPVSPTSKSPSSIKPSSGFPNASGTVVNGQAEDTAVSKAESPSITRSDIAKSLNQAADRVLRNKTEPSSSAQSSLPSSSSQSPSLSSSLQSSSSSTSTAPVPDAGSGKEKKTCGHVFQRRIDGKKFRQVDVSSVLSSVLAPAKPPRLNNVDLQPFLRAYAAAKQEKLEADGGGGGVPPGAGGGEEEVEEIYVEADCTLVAVRGRKGSAKRATCHRVSLIPEFTEEEEEKEQHKDGSACKAVPPPSSDPQELYDDCESAKEKKPRREPPTPPQPEEEAEEDDLIYEPLDEHEPEERGRETTTTEPQPSPPPLPSPNPDSRKAREKDKENREEEAKKKDRAKEEVNKKEEKERKKKEEDLKKMRRKFGLSDTDDKVGDGVVKNNAGGGVFSKDLAVVRGETIAILRMDGNPVGKWLVQNEQGKMGFVNSGNIEISTPTIRHLMAGVKQEIATDEDPEECYEILPEGPDDIYEDV